MLYATDINIYVAQLTNCIATAVDIMKNHGADMEPWMWSRLEDMNCEMRSLTKSLKEHCKEVVE